MRGAELLVARGGVRLAGGPRAGRARQPAMQGGRRGRRGRHGHGGRRWAPAGGSRRPAQPAPPRATSHARAGRGRQAVAGAPHARAERRTGRHLQLCQQRVRPAPETLILRAQLRRLRGPARLRARQRLRARRRRHGRVRLSAWGESDARERSVPCPPVRPAARTTPPRPLRPRGAAARSPGRAAPFWLRPSPPARAPRPARAPPAWGPSSCDVRGYSRAMPHACASGRAPVGHPVRASEPGRSCGSWSGRHWPEASGAALGAPWHGGPDSEAMVRQRRGQLIAGHSRPPTAPPSAPQEQPGARRAVGRVGVSSARKRRRRVARPAGGAPAPASPASSAPTRAAPLRARPPPAPPAGLPRDLTQPDTAPEASGADTVPARTPCRRARHALRVRGAGRNATLQGGLELRTNGTKLRMELLRTRPRQVSASGSRALPCPRLPLVCTSAAERRARPGASLNTLIL